MAPTKTRTFSMSLDINATPEDVWRALTDAGEADAVVPAAGARDARQGRVRFSGDGTSIGHGSGNRRMGAGQAPQARREPSSLRCERRAAGGPLATAGHGIHTRDARRAHEAAHRAFRLWRRSQLDDELESVSGGWQFELRSLRHYLEHHKGRDRHYATAHFVTSLSAEDVWTRLFSSAAFPITRGSLSQGERVSIVTATGDEIAGTVGWHNPGHDLFVTVDDLNDGVFRLSTWRAGSKTGLPVWMTTYDPRHAARVREFGARAQELIERLFQ